MGNPELTAQIRNPGGPWDLRLASEVGQPCGTGPDPWGLRSLRTVRVGVEVLDSQRQRVVVGVGKSSNIQGRQTSLIWGPLSVYL